MNTLLDTLWYFCYITVELIVLFIAITAIVYNPQNETCDALRTKRAKNKTKRFSVSKRSVPLTRFPEHPFFKKISTRLRRDLPASRLSI